MGEKQGVDSGDEIKRLRAQLDVEQRKAHQLRNDLEVERKRNRPGDHIAAELANALVAHVSLDERVQRARVQMDEAKRIHERARAAVDESVKKIGEIVDGLCDDDHSWRKVTLPAVFVHGAKAVEIDLSESHNGLSRAERVQVLVRRTRPF